MGEMTPPCGTPSRIFTLLLTCLSNFTFAGPSPRENWIHLYVVSEIPLSGRTLPKDFVRSKKRETILFLFFKGIFCLLGNEGQRIFCASKCLIMSLVTPFGPDAFLHVSCLIAISVFFADTCIFLIVTASQAELAAF